MSDYYYSTCRNQPRPAREIALHVRAVEHQAAVAGALAFDIGSTRLARALRALPQKLRMLVAFL